MATTQPIRNRIQALKVAVTQSLARRGASLVEMQTAGRWKSPVMPAHYAQAELAALGAVARLRYSGGRTK